MIFGSSRKCSGDQGLFIQYVQNPTPLTTIFIWNSAIACLFLDNLKAAQIGGTKKKIEFHFIDLSEIVIYLIHKPIKNEEPLGKILDLKRIRSSGRILN
jgi:hypothetical protein